MTDEKWNKNLQSEKYKDVAVNIPFTTSIYICFSGIDIDFTVKLMSPLLYYSKVIYTSDTFLGKIKTIKMMLHNVCYPR